MLALAGVLVLGWAGPCFPGRIEGGPPSFPLSYQIEQMAAAGFAASLWRWCWQIDQAQRKGRRPSQIDQARPV